MIKKHQNFWLNCLFSVAIFAMLFVSLFFYQAHVDNYIFYTFTDFNFKSILDYCLHYGNGRLLGNTICAVSSHLFNFTSLLVSLSLLAITLLLNRLFFNSNYKTLLLVFFPVLIIEFLSSESIYGASPIYINYVLPFLFFLFSIYFYSLSNNHQKSKRILYNFLMCLCSLSACLFSENTTILFVLFALLLVFCDYKKQKKLKSNSILLFVSFLCGTLFMLLIPHIFGVANLLDWYRGSLELNAKNIVIQAAHLSYCIAEFSPLLLTISLSIISYLFFITDKKASLFFILTIITIPIVIIFIANKSSLEYILTRLILCMLICIFAIAVLIALFVYTKKEHRLVFWGLPFIVLSGIGMCLFVEPIGVRLIFAPYFFALIWLFSALKEAFPKIKQKINIPYKPIVLILFIVAFLLSTFSFFENVDSFNEQIYSIVDETTQQTIDLDDNGINLYKFI